MTAVGTGPKPSLSAETPDCAGTLQNDVHKRDLGCSRDLPPGCRAVVDGDATAIIDVPTAKRVSPFEIWPMPVSTRVKHVCFHEFSAENSVEGDAVFVTLPIARTVWREGRWKASKKGEVPCGKE